MRYLRFVGATLVVFGARLDRTVGLNRAQNSLGTITATLDVTRDTRLVRCDLRDDWRTMHPDRRLMSSLEA